MREYKEEKAERSHLSTTIFQHFEATALPIWYMEITCFTQFLVQVHEITWLKICSTYQKKLWSAWYIQLFI